MGEKEPQNPSGAIWLLIVLVLILLIGAVSFWSSRDANFLASKDKIIFPIPSRQPRTYTIFYDLNVFSPTNIRIHVGDTVKFQNNDKNSIRVVTDSSNNKPDLPGFDSVGDVPENGAFSFTFSKSGIFGYHNLYDNTQKGSVIVRP